MTRGETRRPGERTRIGAWRLLDLAQASLLSRAGLLAGGGVSLPEYGPPDWEPGARGQSDEMPGSNIGEDERRAAVERERTRRWLAVRRARS